MVENWKNPKILQTEWKTVTEGTDSSWLCLKANNYEEESEDDRESSSHKNQEDGCVVRLEFLLQDFNRYRRKRPKVDASIFDSTLSHTRRLDASGKKEKKIARPLLEVFACGQVSSPRLYRLRIKFEIEFANKSSSYSQRRDS